MANPEDGITVAMANTLRFREACVRRALAKRGHRLCKSPTLSWERRYYGVGYIIVDSTNTVREGCRTRQYDADIDRVEWFTFEHLAAHETA
jgi:hypothetical protein